MSLPRSDRFKIEQHLFSHLLEITIDDEEELDDVHRRLDLESLNRINEAILPITGIGDDCIWFNEHMGDHTILDFPTLYDYDLHDHEFQEEARKQEFPDYEIQPHRGALHARWIRLFVEGRFSYGVLYCAAGYIFSEVENFSSELIEDLIPHKLERGKNHGKREGKGFLFDFKTNAHGKEQQLDELRHRYWAYQKERYIQLQKDWDEAASCQAVILDTSRSDDPETTFILSDKTALKQIRMLHFMADCREIEVGRESLDQAIAQERQLTEAYLREQYDDIEMNFDPKVTKLRRKRKIIMAPEAVDDFDRLF